MLPSLGKRKANENDSIGNNDEFCVDLENVDENEKRQYE
jgi:hypothetical protein